MKKDIKVSIIVPVYNVEKYLHECLDSLCNQTYDNIEIILIDDGSSDGSEAICKRFSDKDKRVVFLAQKHAGAVGARKRGIENSQGEYLTFVDADDYVKPSYVDYLLKKMHQCDIVTSRLQYGERFMQNAILSGVYSGNKLIDVYANMLISNTNGGRGILTNMCGKMFKTAMAREVMQEVDERIYYGEDAEFVYRYLLKCSTICITDYCGYVYRINNNSVCHIVHDDYLENLNFMYLSLKDAFEKSDYKNVLIPQLQRWIAGLLCSAPHMMGFSAENNILIHFMPIFPEIVNQQIIIYGAGAVGRDYMRQIIAQQCSTVVAWVDRNWNSMESSLGDIRNPECIADLTWDYIIIAVNDTSVAESIISNLVSKGVKRERILWKNSITM